MCLKRSFISLVPPNHLVTQIMQSVMFSFCIMRSITIPAPISPSSFFVSYTAPSCVRRAAHELWVAFAYFFLVLSIFKNSLISSFPVTYPKLTEYLLPLSSMIFSNNIKASVGFRESPKSNCVDWYDILIL